MKNLRFFTLLLAVLTLLYSCKDAGTTSGTESADAGENVFGQAISNTASARPFDEIANLLNAADSVRTVLRAKVSEVCQAKGCWMNIVDPVTDSEESIFVQFQDYGFFVPKDLAGKEVLIEGVGYKEVTSVEELKHYAEDAEKSAEEIAAITEPVVEKKFMATGVVVLP